MIIFNLIGLLMLAISFGLAYGITRLFGTSDSFVFMSIGGVLTVICDVAYRWLSPTGHWFSPGGGGSVFFLPLWLLGALALAYSLTEVLTGEPPTNLAIWITLGVVLVVLIVVGIAKLPPEESAPSEAPLEVSQSKDWECSRCGQLNASYYTSCGSCHIRK
jgi:hypothetical protein